MLLKTYVTTRQKLALHVCFITELSLLCDLLGLSGRPSLDTLRGIAAGLLKSVGGALMRVPPMPAARV